MLSILVNSQVFADMTLEVHGLSKHFDTQQEFNEKNWGLGVVQDNLSVGVYRNSLDKNSIYVVYTTQKKVVKNINLGLDLGVVTGYNNSVAPLLVPILIIKTADIYTLRFRVLPAIQDITPAVVSMSFGIKFNLYCFKEGLENLF